MDTRLLRACVVTHWSRPLESKSDSFKKISFDEWPMLVKAYTTLPYTLNFALIGRYFLDASVVSTGFWKLASLALKVSSGSKGISLVYVSSQVVDKPTA
jgi:hypothetical protein